MVAPPTVAAPVAAPPIKGPIARFYDWVKHFFRPAPPTPPTPPEVHAGPIQVYFTNTYATTNKANEVTSQADPNNPDHKLVALFDSIPAGGVLDGAFFDIGVKDVVDAMVRAKQRGVNVRLVTETDYYQDKSGALRAPIQQLQAAGIPVIPDGRGGLMHDKFLVAKGGPAGDTVWTGSYNITDGGTYHDNNNALALQSSELAAIYEAEFKKMFEDRNFGTSANGTPHPTPRPVTVGDVTVTPYFSPNTKTEGGGRQAILDAIASAHKSIQFLSFAFDDPGIAQAMIDKAQGPDKVKVSGVFETSQAKSRYSSYNQLAPLNGPNSNINVRMDGNQALMHHKVIIVDDDTLITGSFNFSNNAQNSNDENLLVITHAPELVKQYRDEFNRVQAVAKPAQTT